MGNDLGTETTLGYNFTNLFIKAPYSNEYKHAFLKFDADELVEIIEEYLSKEIDFPYYKATGIIKDCYMLHKGDYIE